MLELIEKVLAILARMLKAQSDKDFKRMCDNTKAMEALRAENSKYITHKTKCDVLAKRIENLTS